MRVLQISSAKTFGGGERHFVDLCRGLQERGHEVFVALRPSNEWQHHLDFIPRENFLYVSIRNSFGMFSTKKIARFLKDKNIDIIHAHVARDYLAAGIACRISKDTRFVLTRHVMFSMKPFHKFALNNLNAAIAVTPAVATQLEKIFPRKLIHVIYNGLDVADGSDRDTLNREFRTLHGIPMDVPLVGTIGELKLLKGQRDFVLAANEITKRHPDCRFVVAGTDNSADKKFRRELRRLAKVSGLADRFLWLDWIDDTAPFFAALDVFVSPSHSESFGLAILEAMARGRPVVATATDGAKELIGGIGSLVEINDPVGLAAAVTQLLSDDQGRHEMGNELRKIAAERFSVSRMVTATETLYSEVMAA